MGEIDIAGGGVLALLVAVVAGLLCMALMFRLTARRGIGFFHYFPYAVLLNVAVRVFFSARTFGVNFEMQSGLLADDNPVSRWTSRLTSLFLLLAAVERVASYALRRNHSGITRYMLLVAFVVFWCTNVASPALFSVEGSFSHDYLYTFAMGCAAVLLSQREGDAAVAAARNGLAVLLAVSVVLIPLRPTLVLDFNYAEGLIPGVPRLAGLASHSVSLGMLSGLGLLCLYAQPFTSRWLNRLCWLLGLSTLFLAQSKTSWISFPVCMICISWVRGDLRDPRRFGDPRPKLSTFPLRLVLPVAIVGLGLAYVIGDLAYTIDSFVGQHGASLSSLSGRDRIWAVALEDWARHPILGYGSNLFDQAYRAAVSMPYANDGHNQFVDTLARSGLVGAAGLLLYATALLAFAVKYGRASGGLSLAICLALIIRSVSQVSLGVFQYGAEVLQHFLLLAVVAGSIGAGAVRRQRNVGRRRSRVTTYPPRSDGSPELVPPLAGNPK